MGMKIKKKKKWKYGMSADTDIRIFFNICNEMLNEGWEPVGGVAMYPRNDNVQWAQAFKILVEE